MSWLGDNWADLISSAFGFLEAKDKSKNTVSPKDLFYMGNPNYSNPFQTRTTSWDGGKPSVTQQFTPEMLELINGWMDRAALAGEGRTPYGMNDGMRDVYGAQQNWQRERFGLDPVARPEQYDPYGGSDSITGGNVGDITNPDDPNSFTGGEQIPDYISDSDLRDTSGGRLPAGSNEDFYDEIQRALLDQNRIRELSRGGSDLTNVWDASDIEKLFGQGDIGSPAMLELIDSLGGIGAGAGGLLGIPFLGSAGERIGDSLRDNWTWMSPTNPSNPWELDGSGARLIEDAFRDNYEYSGLDDGNTNPMTGGRGQGGYSSGGFAPNTGGAGGSAGRGWGWGQRASRIKT
jgi:hypothetical protein